MATLEVKTMSGATSPASIEISDSWLEREKGAQAVKESVVAFMAGQRSGTASTKNRSLVKGSGRKPWRQKGTGRARAGSTRSPLWRGGGVVFGPQPRSYAKKVNIKVEKLALKRVFTDRLDAGEIIVVDEIAMTTPKTKEFVAFLKNIGVEETALILVDNTALAPIEDDNAKYGWKESNLYLASRNLGNVIVTSASNVNAYTLMQGKKVVITSAGLQALGQRLA